MPFAFSMAVWIVLAIAGWRIGVNIADIIVCVTSFFLMGSPLIRSTGLIIADSGWDIKGKFG